MELFIGWHQNLLIEKKYDYKCDIYSLGITILEMVNGHPPHYNKDAVAVMFLIMNNNDNSNNNNNNNESDYIFGGIEIPNKLGKNGKMMVKQCLQRNQNLRPSAKELLQDHPFLYEQDDTVEMEQYQQDNSDDEEEEYWNHDMDENNQNEQPVIPRLKCIDDVKQIVEKRVEYQNKARMQLLDRKYKRDIYKKTQKKNKSKR